MSITGRGRWGYDAGVTPNVGVGPALVAGPSSSRFFQRIGHAGERQPYTLRGTDRNTSRVSVRDSRLNGAVSSFKYVDFLWDDAKAAALDPVGRPVYRSNLLGADQRVTNTGGGNTASRLTDRDPLTG